MAGEDHHSWATTLRAITSCGQWRRALLQELPKGGVSFLFLSETELPGRIGAFEVICCWRSGRATLRGESRPSRPRFGPTASRPMPQEEVGQEELDEPHDFMMQDLKVLTEMEEVQELSQLFVKETNTTRADFVKTSSQRRTRARSP